MTTAEIKDDLDIFQQVGTILNKDEFKTGIANIMTAIGIKTDGSNEVATVKSLNSLLTNYLAKTQSASDKIKEEQAKMIHDFKSICKTYIVDDKTTSQDKSQ